MFSQDGEEWALLKEHLDEELADLNDSKVLDEDAPLWMRGRLMNGKILDDELEDELQKQAPEGVTVMPFDKWHLVRKLETDEKGALRKNLGSGNYYGEIKGLVRVIDHSKEKVAIATATIGSQMKRKDINALSNRLPFPIDVNELMTPKQVVVRLYCTKAFGLPAMDKGNTADPYITCRLGHEVQGDSSEYCKATVDPYFGRCYEFHTTMPGPANLHIIVKDFDKLGRDEEIGRTVIDLEDRFFGKRWQEMGKKPLERRTLRLPGSKMSRGKMECWVDIMTKAEALKSPPVDISADKPALFEMRMVVWQARNVPALDMMSKMNDMFVSAHLTTVGADGGKPVQEQQETDVHWRSKGKKGTT